MGCLFAALQGVQSFFTTKAFQACSVQDLPYKLHVKISCLVTKLINNFNDFRKFPSRNSGSHQWLMAILQTPSMLTSLVDPSAGGQPWLYHLPALPYQHRKPVRNHRPGLLGVELKQQHLSRHPLQSQTSHPTLQAWELSTMSFLRSKYKKRMN